MITILVKLVKNSKKTRDIKETLNKILDFINHIFRENIQYTAIYFRYRLQTLFNVNPIDNTNRSGLENLISEVIKKRARK